METSTWKGIWVYLENVDGEIEPVSWEILGKGRELADISGESLTGVLLGHNNVSRAEEALQRGADRVVVADHPLLEMYSWEAYTKVMADLVTDRKPNILLIGATHNGREFAGRLAVRLNTGLTADVVRLEIDNEGVLTSAVPGFGGSILAMIKWVKCRPQMSTVRAGIFEALEPITDFPVQGVIENAKVTIPGNLIRTRLVKRTKVEGVDISKAERLVAAGRGSSANFDMIRELAGILDAAIGVTRPLADMGLISRDHQIGSTGVIVKPSIAIVSGASGAAHFVSGIQNSDAIISINSDEDAQIFDHSDCCVVGDSNAILPALLKELRTRGLKGTDQKSRDLNEGESTARGQKGNEFNTKGLSAQQSDERDRQLNVVVCVKVVPKPEEVRLDPETKTLERGTAESILNPPDKNSMEIALSLKEEHGGRITVMSMGPPFVDDFLRLSMAMGADDTILLSDRAFAGADTYPTCLTLAQGIKVLKDVDLVICGEESADGGTGQVPPGLAEWLDFSLSTYVNEIQYDPSNDRFITRRSISNGYEVISIPRPAVVSVELGVNSPRFPDFTRKKELDRSHKVRIWNAEQLGLDSEVIGLKGSLTTVDELIVVKSAERKKVFIEGTPNVIASKLADIIHDHYIQ